MIDLGAVALIKNIDVKAAVVIIRVFKEELNNPSLAKPSTTAGSLT